jgi:hypothetical protein
MIKRTLAKLAAVTAATCAVCATAFVAILVASYPIKAFVPRKYNWLAVPFSVGAILPLSAGMGIVAHRFVKRLMAHWAES